MEREQRETVGCCRRSTNSAVCYGERRNSQGNLGTDRLFTGQRLDDTGLYYYGARYYDASIGRFISADPIVPSFANPQSFNRYSYVLNNPLKYIDPSGLDWVFVGGHGQYNEEWNKESPWWDAPQWAIDIAIAGGFNEEVERLIFVQDQEDPWGHKFEAQDQYFALRRTLDAGDYTDIKLVGYSEGAAAVAWFLAGLADKDWFMASTNVRNQLTAAILLECPTGWTDTFVGMWDETRMVDLPDRLREAGLEDVKLADIWDLGSWGHKWGPVEGWEKNSYPYGSKWGRLNPFAQGSYHSKVLTASYTLRTVRELLND